METGCASGHKMWCGMDRTLEIGAWSSMAPVRPCMRSTPKSSCCPKCCDGPKPSFGLEACTVDHDKSPKVGFPKPNTQSGRDWSDCLNSLSGWPSPANPQLKVIGIALCPVPPPGEATWRGHPLSVSLSCQPDFHMESAPSQSKVPPI